MDVMIGVDPHKGSHTATMLDRGERELRRITVRAGRRQVEQLLEWVDGHQAAHVGGGGRRWDGLSALPAARRRRRDGAGRAGDVGVTGTGAGHRPVHQERCQRRPFGRRRRVARPGVGVVRPADHVTVCRLLAKHHTDVARWRTKLCCRLHAFVGELVPGGIDKEVVVTQARSMLDEHRLWRRGGGRTAPPGGRAGRRDRTPRRRVEGLEGPDHRGGGRRQGRR